MGARAYRVEGLGLGLNLAEASSRLADGQAADLLNLIPTDRGGARTRPGSVTLFTAAENINSLSPVEGGGTAGDRLIYSTTAGRLVIVSFFPGLNVSLATGLTAGAPWKFLRLPTVSGQGPYFGMNGVDTPRWVDGTTSPSPTLHNWTATAGTLPNGKYMVYAGNRLWVAGVASDPYAVFYSEVGDPTNWPAANVTRFDPNDGHILTGLGTCGPHVLVFKDRAIYRVYDLDTSANVKIGEVAGTPFGQSIVDTGEGCAFFDGRRGVCITDGQDVKQVSDAIFPGVSFSAPAPAAAFNGVYYISANITPPGGSATSVLLALYLDNGTWWVHGFDTGAIASWDISQQGLPDLYISSARKFMRIMDRGRTTDDAAAIPWRWTGGVHDFEIPHVAKRVREFLPIGSGVADVDLARTPSLDTVTDVGVDLSAHMPMLTPGVADGWQVTLRGTSSADIDGYEFLYDSRRGRS